MQLIAILTLFSIQLFARTAAKETCPLVLGHRGAPGVYPEDTGKSFSEALILTSTNPQYDKRLFIDLGSPHKSSLCTQHVLSL